MATLEKIRSKSVMLFVVIIVALLAFILGDFFNSGRAFFGPGTTMVEAGDVEVDYQKDYSPRTASLNNAYGDPEEQSQQLLRELALEKMLENEYDVLGIAVTDEEISRAITGETPHPSATQFVAYMSQVLGLANPSGAAVLDAVNNPAKYNLTPEMGAQLKEAWIAQEKNLENAMKFQKFNSLVAGLYTANELDAKQLYNDIQNGYTLTYASKPVASVGDDEVEITDEDRKAAWEEHKYMFVIEEPTRVVDYICVPVEPSQADYAAAKDAVEKAVAALDGVEGLAAVNSDKAFNIVRNRVAEVNQAGGLKNFLDTAKVNDAVLMPRLGKEYTLYKLMSKTDDIDSINISMARSTDRELLDSISKTIGAGKFVAAFEGTDVQAVDSIWDGLYSAQVPADLKAALTNNTVGEAFILTDSIQGQKLYTLYRINQRHAPVPVYEYAEIKYVIDPSTKTISDLSSAITTYVSNNSSADAFVKNAAESNYTIETAEITASSGTLAGLPKSRTVVKWLMEAEQGKVMPVYQDQSYFLTAIVKGVYNDDYLPWNAVNIAEAVDGFALNNKKAQKIIDELNGKATDVKAYAELMGTNVQTNSRFTFDGGLGFASNVHGAVAAAEDGKVSGPMQNGENVIVFSVKKNEAAAPEFKAAEYVNQFNNKFAIGNAASRNGAKLFDMLLGSDKYENSSLNFVQDFAK